MDKIEFDRQVISPGTKVHSFLYAGRVIIVKLSAGKRRQDFHCRYFPCDFHALFSPGFTFEIVESWLRLFMKQNGSQGRIPGIVSRKKLSKDARIGRAIMDDALKQAFYSRMQEEPFARKFGLKLCDIGAGYSKVEMTFTPDMENMWGCAHGGALFALIDQSFEVAANSHGTLAVALNMSVTFVAPPRPGSVLSSEAKETYQTRKTASYDIKVRDGSGALIASCQALVYRKGTPLPFLKNNPEEPRR